MLFSNLTLCTEERDKHEVGSSFIRKIFSNQILIFVLQIFNFSQGMTVKKCKTHILGILYELNKGKGKKLHGLSPRANYTDLATAACRRRDCQILRIESATWSA
jgi:hypothetical protein